MQKEDYLKLTPQQFRNFLLEKYSNELQESIKDGESTEILAGLQYLTDSSKEKRKEKIHNFQKTIEQITSSTSDYLYWVKSAYWTKREACALLSGLDPDAVREIEDSLITYKDAVSIGIKYSNTRRLYEREFGHDTNRSPNEVIEWARNIELDLPQAIIKLHDKYFSQANSKLAEALVEINVSFTSRERTSMLRVISALSEMAKLPVRGAATSVEKQLEKLGFTSPKERTIKDLIDEARALEKDKP